MQSRPPAAGPRGHVDQDEHWTLVRRMLHNENAASAENRAAACLVLLYAQPVSKIFALTTDYLTLGDDGTYLRLGPEPASAASRPTRDFPADRQALRCRQHPGRRTLAVPGQGAGHHQHPASLMGRLNRLGIMTRASRNSAMLHLAATRPPAVFASLIGISIGAATRWAEYAGSNWTTYAAIRTKATAGPREDQ